MSGAADSDGGKAPTSRIGDAFMRLKREGRLEIARACFDFLPTRARLDLDGWADKDIFTHD